MSPTAIIIGAGIGGLTTAALLAKAGWQVTVLEAHIYPGGCAGTFYHRGYRFEAGATLAGGFYRGGPMDLLAQAVGIDAWDCQLSDPALAVHLPNGHVVSRWGDEPQRTAAHLAAFGSTGAAFLRQQERLADGLWDFALRLPAFPPQTLPEIYQLLQKSLTWLRSGQGYWRQLPQLLRAAVSSTAQHLPDANPALQQFVDGQLLIAAQATSRYANALYGAAALDLPRRGVVHFRGGMGRMAQQLATAVLAQGGQVLYRQPVRQIHVDNGRIQGVTTQPKSGARFFSADVVIANLPPWNLRDLLGEAAPHRLRRLPSIPKTGGGAFMLYVGLPNDSVPLDLILHHQVIVTEPLGEGNSVFLSLSPAWDESRAPSGMRALTISTHTDLAEWWRLFEHDPAAYTARRTLYADKMLQAAERVLPNLRQTATLVKTGTPVTFHKFTQRVAGWVGGFPQTNLWQAWAPRIRPGVWLVGDSIFPGQSTAAVALGGLRVAQALLAQRLAG